MITEDESTCVDWRVKKSPNMKVRCEDGEDYDVNLVWFDSHP